MAHTTNLRVAFKKTVQPRDYESETAEVEMSIVVDDDEDADEVATDALNQAKDQVFAALGRKMKDKR